MTVKLDLVRMHTEPYDLDAIFRKKEILADATIAHLNRPWRKQASNWIALAAVVVSAGTLAIAGLALYWSIHSGLIDVASQRIGLNRDLLAIETKELVAKKARLNFINDSLQQQIKFMDEYLENTDDAMRYWKQKYESLLDKSVKDISKLVLDVKRLESPDHSISYPDLMLKLHTDAQYRYLEEQNERLKSIVDGSKQPDPRADMGTRESTFYNSRLAAQNSFLQDQLARCTSASALEMLKAQ